MKFSLLKQIVISTATKLKTEAAYQGSWGDGGSSALLLKFKDYQSVIVKKFDLRPSEFDQLDNIEVGKPIDFLSEIKKYEKSLIKNKKEKP